LLTEKVAELFLKSAIVATFMYLLVKASGYSLLYETG